MKGNGAVFAIKLPLRRFWLTTVPAVIGWLCLLLPTGASALTFVMAFIVTFIIDVIKVRDGEVPYWYPKLRWPFTVIVIFCLVLSALF